LMDLQRHPATGFPTHADFERVTKSTIVHKRVPLHFLNEEGVIKAGGKVLHAASEVEVTCKVGDLPEFIAVDVAGLTVGTVIHLAELKLPKGVTLIELKKGADHDAPVVSIVKATGGDVEEAAE
jgi:large subunit ribosomal protein L25